MVLKLFKNYYPHGILILIEHVQQESRKNAPTEKFPAEICPLENCLSENCPQENCPSENCSPGN